MGDCGERSRACPDDLSQGKYFNVQVGGVGNCHHFVNYGVKTVSKGEPMAVESCNEIVHGNGKLRTKPYMFKGTIPIKLTEADVTSCKAYYFDSDSGTGLTTKAQVIHPNGASRTVGGIALKRIAPCKKEELPDGGKRFQCTDVYKVGVCIDCKSLVPLPCVWYGAGKKLCAGTKDMHQKAVNSAGNPFHNKYSWAISQDELYHFGAACIVKAFDREKGELNPDFRCGEKDQARFDAFLRSF